MSRFKFIVQTHSGFDDVFVCIAACRAGEFGVLNLEFSQNLTSARQAVQQITRFTPQPFGLKLSASQTDFVNALTGEIPRQVRTLIFPAWHPDNLEHLIPTLRTQGFEVLLEVTNAKQVTFAHTIGVDGLIAKGNESGGWVGEETTFILLQQLLKQIDLPVWASGGIGLHSIAACYVAGAAGVVLDDQLTLTRESQLPHPIRTAIAAMDGSETICLGPEIGRMFRTYTRPDAEAVQALEKESLTLAQSDHSPETRARIWEQTVSARVGQGSLRQSLWPLGQAAAFAKPLADRYKTVGGILKAMREAMRSHANTALQLRPFAENSSLAQSHRTRYPIVQGPMTRVSDRAEFALKVADSGGLPFLALALMRKKEVAILLQETKQLLGDHPWGVGILGFVPLDLRQEQLAVVHQIKPSFAIIAGGRPDQAQQLEAVGIATYLHVPSPGLLRSYINNGARRFIFEGRECGGHVGPRSSFVLWDTMVDVLMETLPEKESKNCHILFAGGIHDRLSAAMVGALAAPLSERGIRIGVLMGTAYLFTEEAVSSGAILSGFQKEALQCDNTTLVESGPGHATRCVPTPFVETFKQEKIRLQQAELSSEEIRGVLEDLNIGRLRIASKGITRNEQYGKDANAPKYVELTAEQQHQAGMYMIGQVAALRQDVITMEALHREVSDQGSAVLERIRDEARTLKDEGNMSPSRIAIIGMSCILPGAKNLQAYWENILDKVDAVTEVPKDRWEWQRYFDLDQKARDRVYSRWGGFIDAVPFNPLDYGMPPNSLPSIEPLQLLMLDVVRAGLEDAGYLDRDFPRERTAVVVGAGGGQGDLGYLYSFRSYLPHFIDEENSDAVARLKGQLPEWTEDSFPGILLNVVAGRVANRFDLGGPNFTVDAACASSLAALDIAVKDLEAGRTEMAIIGAGDTVQSPFAFMAFSKTQALSPTGRCRPFDAEADGIAISEGLAVLVLKRLDDAERDGDRIYAVIQGIGASSDGRDKSLTAPRPAGQLRALRRAYAKAGFSPETVGLIEAHGTGTRVGDSVEVESLSQLLLANAGTKSIGIGSVKSMIGHTKSTAGLAGMIKVILGLYHKILPPTLVDQINPKLNLDQSQIYVNAEARPWLTNGNVPRRAGVSAFGFGGVNFHAVLEEYTEDFLPANSVRQHWPAELFLWRTSDAEVLSRDLISFKEWLSASANKPSLRDLAYTLHQFFKASKPGPILAIVANSIEDLERKIRLAEVPLRTKQETFEDAQGIYYAQNPSAIPEQVAFLYPGQGSQYPNMAGDLAMYFPTIRNTFEQANALLHEIIPGLSSYIFPPPVFTEEERNAQKQAITATQIAQPALGATDLALSRLLKDLGIQPVAVAGHSYGEIVALYEAEVIDETSLFAISEARGRLMAEAAGPRAGTMAAISASAETTAALLSSREAITLANLNAPNQTVISGPNSAIEKAIEDVQAMGIKAQKLPVACAFHSPLVAPAAKLLAEFLQTIPFHSPQKQVFSNTTGKPYPQDPDAIRQQLAEQLARPVCFQAEIEAMYAAGIRIFIEAGPRTVLTGLVKQILGDRPHHAVSVDQPGRLGLMAFLRAMGQLTAAGLLPQLASLFEGRAATRLNLDKPTPEPTYSPTTWLVSGGRATPWQKKPAEPETPLRVNLVGETPPLPEKVPSPMPPAPSQPALLPVPSQSVDEVTQVMMQYQQMMSQFLETQKSIMLTYLGSAPEYPTPSPAQSVVNALTTPPAPIVASPVFAETPSPDPVPPPSAPASDDGSTWTTEKITRELLALISERTGYPPEMLGLDANMEGDLGIDSIKRVEILNAFQETHPWLKTLLADDGMEQLQTQKTIRTISEWITTRQNKPASNPPANYPLDHQAPSTDHQAPSTNISRFTLSLEDAPLIDITAPLAKDKIILITDDGLGISRTLAKLLKDRGYLVTIAATIPPSNGNSIPADFSTPETTQAFLDTVRQNGPIGMLIHLAPLYPCPPSNNITLESWQNYFQSSVMNFFNLIRGLHDDLVSSGNDACVLMATHQAGMFARDSIQVQTTFNPGAGGLVGLLKTISHELPSVRVRSIDFNQVNCESKAGIPSEFAAEIILEELMANDSSIEVGYDGNSRKTLAINLSPLTEQTSSLKLDENSVILLTGGARGITAEIAKELAVRYHPILILLGRSPLPPADENPKTAHLTEPRAIKETLITSLHTNGHKPGLSEVEAAYAQLMNEREIRANLTELDRLGAKVHYFAVDVRDAQTFRELLDKIHDRFGQIDGVIHGAGIIEDKLLKDKTSASFERVIRTKVDSALILKEKLHPETLQFLAFFTSVSGRFGNKGQSDYALANEVLNKLAIYLDQQWSARVFAVNWGPWEGAGMVSPSLQKEFARRGVSLIPVEAGRQRFLEELLFGQKGDVEILICSEDTQGMGISRETAPLRMER